MNKSFTYLLLICLYILLQTPLWSDPYIDRVVEVVYGTDRDPDFGNPLNVLGPPQSFDDKGLGGSVHVLNLGVGGSVTVEFTDNAIYDGPGKDFVIFENPFYIGGDFSRVYLEPGIVFVSSDGDDYTSFPVNYIPPVPPLPPGDDSPDHYMNFAGIRPVFSNPSNGIDPLNPAVSGGDAFDLADIRDDAERRGIDLQNIRFIRIQDVRRGVDTDKDGDIIPGTTNPLVNGFDLDAIAAIHSKEPMENLRAKHMWSMYE